MKGKIVVTHFSSQCLKGNALGDRVERHFPVYLPKSYSAETSRKFPVIYALASYPESGEMLLYRKPFSESFDERLERLFESGELPECIVVFPDCSTRLGGSQYLNSSATGRYEDYMVSEVVAHIDTHFRSEAKPTHRALMGHSSGGFGALMLAMRHSEVFGLFASHAGDMGFEYCYLSDFPGAMMQISRSGGVETFVEKFLKKPKKRQDEFEAMNILAMAAAYSPNPNAEMGLDLPFDLQSCEIRPSVWQKWLDHDPVRAVSQYVDSLKKVKIYFDCGIFDEYRLFAGARQLSKVLKSNDVTHCYEEFEDNHRSTSYRFERSLSFFGSHWTTISV